MTIFDTFVRLFKKKDKTKDEMIEEEKISETIMKNLEKYPGATIIAVSKKNGNYIAANLGDNPATNLGDNPDDSGAVDESVDAVDESGDAELKVRSHGGKKSKKTKTPKKKQSKRKTSKKH
jgi:hypothetical protein